MRRILAIAVLVAAVASAAYAYLNVDEWIVARAPKSVWQPEVFEFKDLALRADDGTVLHGWFVPNENPRALVVYAPSGYGNVTARAATLKVLHGHGVAVAAFDYRGYGKSAGAPDWAGMLLDGKATRTWMAQTSNQGEDRIVLFGDGIGARVVRAMAKDRGALGEVLVGEDRTWQDRVLAWRLYPEFARSESAPGIDGYEGPVLRRPGEGHDRFTAGFWQDFDAFLASLR